MLGKRHALFAVANSDERYCLLFPCPFPVHIGALLFRSHLLFLHFPFGLRSVFAPLGCITLSSGISFSRLIPPLHFFFYLSTSVWAFFYFTQYPQEESSTLWPVNEITRLSKSPTLLIETISTNSSNNKSPCCNDSSSNAISKDCNLYRSGVWADIRRNVRPADRDPLVSRARRGINSSSTAASEPRCQFIVSSPSATATTAIDNGGHPSHNEVFPRSSLPPVRPTHLRPEVRPLCCEREERAMYTQLRFQGPACGRHRHCERKQG